MSPLQTDSRDDLRQWLMHLRFAIFLIIMVGGALCSHCEVEKVRESYQDTEIEEVAKGAENETLKNALAEMVKQSEQFHSWSVLILGGIVAIIITTKVHKAPGLPWAYIAIGLAGVVLIYSLQAGWVLKKRYTFLVSNNNYTDFNSMNSLLQTQVNLFMFAMLCVSVFASWFLVLIILGKVDPYDPPK